MSASGGDVGQSENDNDGDDSLVYIIVLTIIGVVLILLVVVIVWVVRRRQKRGGMGATPSTASSDMYKTSDNEFNNQSEYGIMQLAPVSPTAPAPMYDSVPRKSRENGSGSGGSSDVGAGASQNDDLYVLLPSTKEVDRV